LTSPEFGQEIKMTSINTNVSSILARNALASNERDMTTSMERLSTGLRINSAKDDAAGLAVSSRMTSQIKGLNQAVRNANDAVSLIQTAEGALVETTNMLQRMRELAVQSASDTNASADRQALDLEFQQLKAEINRVGNNTQWNGENVLNQSYNAGTYKFQVGANAAQEIDITIGDYRTTQTTGTADIVTTAALLNGGDNQNSTITIAGVYAKDDIITVTIDSKDVTYKVTGNEADNNAIAAAVAAAITASNPTGVTTAAATNVITLTGSGANPTGSIVGTAFTVNTVIGPVGLLSDIKDSTITSQADSNAAIAAVDAAISAVNTGRAGMGAIMNRLEYAADNLANISANATQSRGRVLDADYAKETTELARTQIISQAGTAMLAQANQVKQTVLSLLK
jgi:flagellin